MSPVFIRPPYVLSHCRVEHIIVKLGKRLEREHALWEHFFVVELPVHSRFVPGEPRKDVS